MGMEAEVVGRGSPSTGLANLTNVVPPRKKRWVRLPMAAFAVFGVVEGCGRSALLDGNAPYDVDAGAPQQGLSTTGATLSGPSASASSGASGFAVGSSSTIGSGASAPASSSTTGSTGGFGSTSSSGASGSASSSASVSTSSSSALASGPPSCQPGGPGMTNCGPGGMGDESCCTSPEVTPGSYNRTYTNLGNGPTAEADPATVSGFRLDKYLVTVGRFRQYVNYLTGEAG
ncbi:MAG: hypothetical protein ABSF69_30050, partial [Polyangiaceae bacterium]